MESIIIKIIVCGVCLSVLLQLSSETIFIIWKIIEMCEWTFVDGLCVFELLWVVTRILNVYMLVGCSKIIALELYNGPFVIIFFSLSFYAKKEAK
jgi:hypothetical protein